MEIKNKLKTTPTLPGVYLMKDVKGRVIYVGKARSLADRVRSYFRGVEHHNPRTQALVSRIDDFDYIVASSELEALILECNLIKHHRPQYNVLLKDGKGYPFIKVTTNQEYPQVVITRKIERDGARYFGPYTDSGAVSRVVKLVQELFPLCSCPETMGTRNSGRACLNYYIKRCLAPCIGRVGREEYLELVDEVCLFLDGRTEKVVESLQGRMEAAAESMQFERAALVRDRIAAIEKIQQRQLVLRSDLTDRDLIALASDGGRSCIEIFLVREGKMVGREHFFLEGEDVREETLSTFIKQHYALAPFIPGEIMVETFPTDKALLEDWLSGLRGKRVNLIIPKRGDKKKLLELAAKNALLSLRDKGLERRPQENREALLTLKEVLVLSGLPERIECFDVSNIQGQDAVASMVVFEDGEPRKSAYRRFKIRGGGGLPDDFAMLNEAVGRRYRRLLKEDGDHPDLILIDGGKGQLSASKEALDEIGLKDIPVASIAKKEEHIFVPDISDPIVLPHHSPGLKLIQRVRDEAHRFALTYHRKLRGRRMGRSALDDIPGIGPKRKGALLRRFGSVRRIKDADVGDLRKVEGIDEKTAKRIYSFFTG